jgi:hypothetical protein
MRMKKLFTGIKEFFKKTFAKSKFKAGNGSLFSSMQRVMLGLILQLKAAGIKLLGAQKNLAEAQQRIDKFLDINKDLRVEDLSVENMNARRRIKNRIRATSAVDGICGLMATTVMLKVFLNVALAWIPAMLIGCVVAYWLLLYAIESRIDEQDDKTQSFWGRFVYIIPLIFIPAANLFVVFTNPGNPVNVLLTGFLVLTLLLNLSTARYYRQYKLMKDTEKSLAVIKGLKNERTKHEDIVNTLRQKVNELADQIMMHAFDMRAEYATMSVKPELILSKDQQMFLNSRVYKEDVYPIGQITLTKPVGELADLSRIWDAATLIEIPASLQQSENRQEPIEPEVISNENPQTRQQVFATDADENPIPGFEEIVEESVNENEIIV